MKATRIFSDGSRREVLLKESLIAASMIALLKRLGEEAAKALPASRREGIPVKVRYDR